jgi:hypothetical protein
VAPGLLYTIRLCINYIASLPDGEGEREGDGGRGRERGEIASGLAYVCVCIYVYRSTKMHACKQDMRDREK